MLLLLNDPAFLLLASVMVTMQMNSSNLAVPTPLSSSCALREVSRHVAPLDPSSLKVKVKSFSRVRLFATPMDCSLPGSSVYGVFQARVLGWVAISFSRKKWKWKLHLTLVHGVLQARILEWVAIPFSRGPSQPRNRTQVSHSACRFFTSWATREALPWNNIHLLK